MQLLECRDTRDGFLDFQLMPIRWATTGLTDTRPQSVTQVVTTRSAERRGPGSSLALPVDGRARAGGIGKIRKSPVRVRG